MVRLAGILFYVCLAVLVVSCTDSFEDDLEKKASRLFYIENNHRMILLSRETSPSFDVKSVSWWMSHINGEKSNQGADCFGNLLCQYRADHSSLDIMDMRQRRHVASISLLSLGSAYHCNNADFSNFFYDEADDFPLLYSSHQGEDARCILVDRIFKVGGEYKLETIQTIEIPYEIDESLQYTPDAIIDKENQYVYVYTGNTIPLTSFYIYKFRLPSFTKGKVSLTEKDIEAIWVITDNPPKYKQGGMIKNQNLYLMEGVPGWDSDNILRVIDLQKGSYTMINLTKRFNAIWEPEDIFWYNGNFYIASNRSGIYQVQFKKLIP